MDDLEIPRCDQLQAGIKAYEANERRADVYFQAMSKISQQWGDASEMARGIKLLLDAWHQTFYRFGNFDFSLLVDCVTRNLGPINSFQPRSIDSLASTDENAIKQLFEDFLDALRGGNRRSPVAVAKSLHLLAPNFFPLWDTEIAIHYSSWWAFSMFGAMEYVPFCWKMKHVAQKLANCECILNSSPKRSALKLIDEFNYSAFTKRWIVFNRSIPAA